MLIRQVSPLEGIADLLLLQDAPLSNARSVSLSHRHQGGDLGRLVDMSSLVDISRLVMLKDWVDIFLGWIRELEDWQI